MCYMAKIISSRLCTLLRYNDSAINLSLCILSLLLGLGVMFGDTNNTIFHSQILWSLVFFTYSVTKLWHLVSRTPLVIKTINSVTGLWLWTYLVIRFIILDTATLLPIDLVLILPLIWELSYLTALIYTNKRLFKQIDRRSTNVP